MKNHLVNHISHGDLVSDSTLHVVGVISNPVRYHSRYRLHREWAEHIGSQPNIKMYVVEAAFGDRHHEVTEVGNPQHLQVRTRTEIWNKENLINLGVKHLLPLHWRYMAWVDCDVIFRDNQWGMETMHQLQHYPVLQPWQSAVDIGATENVLQTFTSFGYRHQMGGPKQAKQSDPYPYGHCGFAWACTRSFWEAVNGLLDFCILGSADHHMAWAMIGQVEKTLFGGSLGKSYARRCLEWQQRATRVTHKQVGFSLGRLEHNFHGPKKRRGYQERWKILLEHNFDPDHDLMYDHQGLLHLVGKPDLEHALQKYNRSRCEDSIDET